MQLHCKTLARFLAYELSLQLILNKVLSLSPSAGIYLCCYSVVVAITLLNSLPTMRAVHKVFIQRRIVSPGTIRDFAVLLLLSDNSAAYFAAGFWFCHCFKV